MSKFDLGLLFNSKNLVVVIKEKGSKTVDSIWMEPYNHDIHFKVEFGVR